MKDVLHIGLCGNPKSGKTTIADMLAEEMGGVVIDDGLILRKAVPILFGIPEDEPFTQEGKAKVYDVCGRQETVRQMLGELGNWLEGRYSELFMPIRAMQIAKEEYPDKDVFIYPSVRKFQGKAYKDAGGVIVEIENPKAPKSPNAFDVWDDSVVDFWFTNDPTIMSLEGLRIDVRILSRYLFQHLLS